MSALGIELCDAGFQAAVMDGATPRNPAAPDMQGPLDWMGLAFHDGRDSWYGRGAEDAWFVKPRQVAHGIWARLSRESSDLNVEGKAPSFSQLAYFFLRDYLARVPDAAGAGKIVIAVPGAYLKDEATEDEKIGLLLGMIAELKLPLAGIIDMACASLCDPRIEYFDSTMPVVVVDVHLHGAEVTLLRSEGRLQRAGYTYLPQLGFAELLRHLTMAIGNRFLRHTTFDILEDGRIEQVFYRQVKDFLLSGAAEQHFQINTANRAYQMPATREQLLGDAGAFVQSLAQGVQAVLGKSGLRPEQCTVALSGRAAALPGVASRFRAAGLGRLLRLPVGAAAAGAASLAGEWSLPADLVEVPVVRQVPVDLRQRVSRAQWEARLTKAVRVVAKERPSHVICDGIGRGINGRSAFLIGSSHAKADCVLPEEFDKAGEDCLIRLEAEAGQLWMLEPREGEPAMRTLIEAGDRLTVRCGEAETELLFACCDGGGRRDH